MADTTGTFLADQIVINAIISHPDRRRYSSHRRCGTGKNRNRKPDIFPSCFFKNSFTLSMFDRSYPGNFVRKIKAFAGMFCQCLSMTVRNFHCDIPRRVIIIDAVFHRIIHHLQAAASSIRESSPSMTGRRIAPIQEQKVSDPDTLVNHTHSSSFHHRHVPSCFRYASKNILPFFWNKFQIFYFFIFDRKARVCSTGTFKTSAIPY